ncbi:MAG: fimbrial biogenesis outer membrane usher protein [Nitrospirae bacterium]|nr:fimbrial biogenesis outer membrane usher protein [Nitrospirota bacterium]
MTDEHDFLVRIEDLRQMGFSDPSGTVYEIEGERYIALSSIRGVGFNLDEKNLTLEITAFPALLRKQIVDFMPGRQPKVVFTNDTATFLNYRLDYSELNSFDTQHLDLTSQFGASYNHFLLLTDSVYTQTEETRQYTRLMSNLTYDRRTEKQRAILGDFFAQAGELGSSLNLGGISFSKNYLIDPYFIKHPQINYSGTVSLPTELDVSLDGVTIRRERLSPGEFRLQNISTHTGGGLLEIVLKDPFGKEERIRYPFYLTDTLLKSGLHDYSYNLGFLREKFGEESFKYGDLTFSAFHRYGWNDSVTVGFNLEASKGLYNGGPSTSALLMNNWGVVVLTLAASRDSENRIGRALSFNYGYQGKIINGHLRVQGFTENYARLIEVTTTDKTKYETAVGVGYGTKGSGFMTLDYATTIQYIGKGQRTVAATYSRVLTQRSTALITLKRTADEDSAYEIMVYFQYYPGKDTTLSSRYEKSKGEQSGTVQVQKNPPVGEGFGGRMLLERSVTDIETIDAMDAFGQYNLKYGIYAVEYRQSQGNRFTEASASGGIAYLGRTLGLSRPITDGFALVQVDDLHGVRVYYNNQEVGRTGSSGKLLIPGLSSYYDNQISINEHDIPIDRSITEVEKIISPPLRGGAYVPFQAKTFQGITGKIKIFKDGKFKPVEFYEIKMTQDETTITFPTGKEGEFYIEDAPPGIYKASFESKEEKCSFDLEIPVSKESLLDLGDILCETPH